MDQETSTTSVDRFLDLACLAYDGADRSARRTEAVEVLRAEPGLVQSSFYVAVAVGAIDQVSTLLNDDPDAASRAGGIRNWEPLLYLAYARVSTSTVTTDYVAVARLLLDCGADPNASFPLWGSTFTALTGVLGEGEQGPENQPPHPAENQLVDLLLDYGVAANDPQGAYNRMHRPGDTWLQVLLDGGLVAADQINWDMGPGPRPKTLDFLLSHAVDNRFVERIGLLLANGADPSSHNPYNGRPIRTNALLRGASDIVTLLEDAGAEIVPLTVPERFRLALRSGDADEAGRLAEHDPTCLEDPTLLRDAAQLGERPMVELLLSLGADVNLADGGGVTPLHKAAENGHVSVVELLLSNGADPGIQDQRFGSTPQGWAEHAGQLGASRAIQDHR